MDFITKLPVTANGKDAVMTVIDKATKMVHLIPCREAMDAVETARLYWHHVASLHGLPKSLISDRDVRFVSIFWRSLWDITGTKLRMGTSYHPQTSGQVERAN